VKHRVGWGAKGECQLQEKVTVDWCSTETAGCSASVSDNLRFLTPVMRQGNLPSSCTHRARIYTSEAAAKCLAGPGSSVKEEGCAT